MNASLNEDVCITQPIYDIISHCYIIILLSLNCELDATVLFGQCSRCFVQFFFPQLKLS